MCGLNIKIWEHDIVTTNREGQLINLQRCIWRDHFLTMIRHLFLAKIFFIFVSRCYELFTMWRSIDNFGGNCFARRLKALRKLIRWWNIRKWRRKLGKVFYQGTLDDFFGPVISGEVSFTQGSRIKSMPLASFIKECESEKKNEMALYYSIE